MTERGYPPPWTVEVTPNCFIVRDANGQALSYVYYEGEPARRSAAKLLTKDELPRIAANIGKLRLRAVPLSLAAFRKGFQLFRLRISRRFPSRNDGIAGCGFRVVWTGFSGVHGVARRQGHSPLLQILIDGRCGMWWLL
jgi:hypothetical protein